MAHPLDFYVLDPVAAGDKTGAGLDGPYRLQVFSPSLFRFRLEKHGNVLLHFLWYLCCRRGYKIYYVLHQGRVIHWSHVLTKYFRLAFMAAEDGEIGPCWTSPDFRGRGIFPAVLREIVAREPIAGRWFVFARSDNHASKRAIEKAGFQHAGVGRKHGVLRVYRYETGD